MSCVWPSAGFGGLRLRSISCGTAGQFGLGPKGTFPIIYSFLDTMFSGKICCKILGVSRQGYYLYWLRPMSWMTMRCE